MNSKRLYQLFVVLTVLAAVGMLAGAYVLNSMLQKQSAILANRQEQLAVLDGRQTALQRAKIDIAQYQDLGKIAKSIVPQDKNQAQTIGEIVKIAKQNGVQLGGFTFPNSTLGTKGVGTSDALSQLQKVPDIAGVYSLEITVQSDNQNPVSYSNFINFLEGLEQNRRTAQVRDITITPLADNSSLVSFSLTLEEYIKP